MSKNFGATGGLRTYAKMIAIFFFNFCLFIRKKTPKSHLLDWSNSDLFMQTHRRVKNQFIIDSLKAYNWCKKYFYFVCAFDLEQWVWRSCDLASLHQLPRPSRPDYRQGHPLNSARGRISCSNGSWECETLSACGVYVKADGNVYYLHWRKGNRNPLEEVFCFISNSMVLRLVGNPFPVEGEQVAVWARSRNEIRSCHLWVKEILKRSALNEVCCVLCVYYFQSELHRWNVLAKCVLCAWIHSKERDTKRTRWMDA